MLFGNWIGIEVKIEVRENEWRFFYLFRWEMMIICVGVGGSSKWRENIFKIFVGGRIYCFC